MAHKIAGWIFELISISALVAAAVFLGVHWASLPSRIPTHFNVTGQPNRWGSKYMILLLMLLDLVIYLVLSVAARYQKLINLPIKVERESPIVSHPLREMVTLLKVLATLSFSVIIWTVVQTALGNSYGFGRAFLPGLLIANLGIVFFFLFSIRAKHI